MAPAHYHIGWGSLLSGAAALSPQPAVSLDGSKARAHINVFGVVEHPWFTCYFVVEIILRVSVKGRDFFTTRMN
eukprot:9180-Pelagomonas_calceolata.AAC.6